MRTFGDEQVHRDASIETCIYVQRPIMFSGATAGHNSAAQQDRPGGYFA